MKEIDIDLFTKEELIDYIMYLKRKVREYEKYYNVEIAIRRQTPDVSFQYAMGNTAACEVINIPSKRLIVDITNIQKVKEIIEKYP